MQIMANKPSHVIGVDTHRDTNTVAVVDSVNGGVVAVSQFSTTSVGYRQTMAFAKEHSGSRIWAIEGTGSYGAGLTTMLLAQDESVVEVDRPDKTPRRDGIKTDEVDAARAARQALSRPHLAVPRAGGEREALRVLVAARNGAVLSKTQAINQLKATIVSAPAALRERLTGTTDRQVRTCARLQTRPNQDVERRGTVLALRAIAKRVLFLEAEAAEHEREISTLVQTMCPSLTDLTGVGALTAAQVLISWSHSGRFRSEAAFASFAGSSPIPASSGQTERHRLSRHGDRQLNRALYTIAITRLRTDQETQAYTARRLTEGKTKKDIRRCLKRAIARQLYRHLETHTNPQVRVDTT
jgi:transposase